MEQNGNVWNTLEATVSYSAWARLTPTLTHVVAYELATSGAEDGAMSSSPQKQDCKQRETTKKNTYVAGAQTIGAKGQDNTAEYLEKTLARRKKQR